MISGGQTGVDRAALDAALEAGLAIGGWCPRGRQAEDGVIPARYPLRETASSDPAERTRLNVEGGDATLIVACGASSPGTELTVALAREIGRPVYLVMPGEAPAPGPFGDWILANGVRILNVAGPRESECPGIYATTRIILSPLFTELR